MPSFSVRKTHHLKGCPTNLHHTEILFRSEDTSSNHIMVSLLACVHTSLLPFLCQEREERLGNAAITSKYSCWGQIKSQHSAAPALGTMGQEPSFWDCALKECLLKPVPFSWDFSLKETQWHSSIESAKIQAYSFGASQY